MVLCGMRSLQEDSGLECIDSGGEWGRRLKCSIGEEQHPEFQRHKLISS